MTYLVDEFMKFTRKKYLYTIRRKIQDEDHYGQCPKCAKLHKKGDIVFGRWSKRYCLDCYMLLFGKYGVKKFLTEYANRRNMIVTRSNSVDTISEFTVNSQMVNVRNNKGNHTL